MNWKETHTKTQVSIEDTVTNRVLFHDCEYVTRDSKDPENDLSLQIHLGELKKRTVGLDGEEKLILGGLRMMSRAIFETGVGDRLEFNGGEDVEAALETFVYGRPELDHNPLGQMYRDRRNILQFLKTA